ncbi:MAG: peptidylprolyl isomerase [Nonlabens sp.]
MKYFLILLICFTTCVNAQEWKDKTLITIDGKEYDAGTFVRIYSKNLDIVQDDEQKDIDNYLELYIDYRLKLEQAYQHQLDTASSYREEIKKYRNSLAQSYLTDNEVSDVLVREAYDRSLEEVNASHILIKVEAGATPTDTLAAYNKILKIKDQLDQGADFARLAKTQSEGPSSKVSGELGWFSAFKMIYEFETAAYHTAVGSYSEPFRTNFGYHILKVNDRRDSRGEVTVSHIMTFDKPKDSIKTASKRIQELYQQLEQGKKFEEVAREFSDDLNSAQNGGKLRRFGTGGLNSPIFEDKAFSMQKEGSYSEPFQSKFGWHIIRLENRHPLPSFNEQAKKLREKVKKSPRSRKITEAFTSKLKELYSFDTEVKLPATISKIVSDSIVKGKWIYDKEKDLVFEKTLFIIQDKAYQQQEFLEYAFKNQGAASRGKNSKDQILKDLLQRFVDVKLIEFYNENLERDNEDFRMIYDEFKEGILLFELLEKKIWNKAKTDSVRQRDYYEKNKDKYRWKERVDVMITQSTTDSVAQAVRKMLLKGATADELKEALNQDGRTKVIISNGLVETSYSRLPKNFDVKMGVSKVYHSDSDSFHKVVLVNDIVAPNVKTLKEARGEVINDLQVAIEREWEESLRDGRDIKINKSTLKKVKQHFEASK